MTTKTRQVKARKTADSNWLHEPQVASEAPMSLFEALNVVKCGDCGREIQPGEYFSRSADKAGTSVGIRYTHCRECVSIDAYVRSPEEVRLNTPAFTELSVMFRTRENADKFWQQWQDRFGSIATGESLAEALGFQLPDTQF